MNLPINANFFGVLNTKPGDEEVKVNEPIYDYYFGTVTFHDNQEDKQTEED